MPPTRISYRKWEDPTATQRNRETLELSSHVAYLLIVNTKCGWDRNSQIAGVERTNE